MEYIPDYSPGAPCSYCYCDVHWGTSLYSNDMQCWCDHIITHFKFSTKYAIRMSQIGCTSPKLHMSHMWLVLLLWWAIWFTLFIFNWPCGDIGADHQRGFLLILDVPFTRLILIQSSLRDGHLSVVFQNRWPIHILKKYFERRVTCNFVH